MLVSHLHKFIYIKTIKTAGTSTEIFLEPYCFSDIDESHSRTMMKTEEGIVGTRMSQKRAEKSEYYNHMPPQLIKEKLGEEIFNSYTKIANIRNPYDILVSHYFFKSTYDLFAKNKNFSFDQYLLETDVVEKLAINYKKLLFIDDKLVIDEIIRYENLTTDVDNLLKKLNLPEPKRVLSNYKGNTERKGKPYQNFYTEETKKVVEDNFNFYFELFDYTFC